MMPKVDAYYRTVWYFYQKLLEAEKVPGATTKMNWLEYDDDTHLGMFFIVSHTTPPETYESLKMSK